MIYGSQGRIFPPACALACLVDICNYLVNDLHLEPRQAGVEPPWEEGLEAESENWKLWKKRWIIEKGQSRNQSKSKQKHLAMIRTEKEGRPHGHTDLWLNNTQSRRKKRKESVNKRLSWLTSMTQWRSLSLKH